MVYLHSCMCKCSMYMHVCKTPVSKADFKADSMALADTCLSDCLWLWIYVFSEGSCLLALYPCVVGHGHGWLITYIYHASCSSCFFSYLFQNIFIYSTYNGFHECERVVGWGVSEAVPHSSDGADRHTDSLVWVQEHCLIWSRSHLWNSFCVRALECTEISALSSVHGSSFIHGQSQHVHTHTHTHHTA